MTINVVIHHFIYNIYNIDFFFFCIVLKTRPIRSVRSSVNLICSTVDQSNRFDHRSVTNPVWFDHLSQEAFESTIGPVNRMTLSISDELNDSPPPPTLHQPASALPPLYNLSFFLAPSSAPTKIFSFFSVPKPFLLPRPSPPRFFLFSFPLPSTTLHFSNPRRRPHKIFSFFPFFGAPHPYFFPFHFRCPNRN